MKGCQSPPELVESDSGGREGKGRGGGKGEEGEKYRVKHGKWRNVPLETLLCCIVGGFGFSGGGGAQKPHERPRGLLTSKTTKRKIKPQES